MGDKMKYDYIKGDGSMITQNTYYIYDTMFDPGEDHEPWTAIKVYRDGNPIELAKFATEEEADDFLVLVKQFDELFVKCAKQNRQN